MPKKTAHVSLSGQRAEVKIGTRSLLVEASYVKTRKFFSPAELIISALGSWVAQTLAAVAENKKYQLKKIEVNIEQQISDKVTMKQPFKSSYIIQLDFGSALSKKERTILLRAAEHCHVHKILESEATFDFQLIDYPD